MSMELISREEVLKLFATHDGKYLYEAIRDMPSVKQDNIKALGEELRSVRNGIKDENVLIGYNMAVAICNKYLEVSE